GCKNMQRCRKRISFGNLTATVSTFYWAGRPISPTTSDKLTSRSGNRRSAASGRLAAEQGSVQRQSNSRGWLHRICLCKRHQTRPLSDLPCLLAKHAEIQSKSLLRLGY